MIAGDLNARIGNEKIPNLIGPNGEETIKGNGIKLRDVCAFNNLRVTTSFFKHKDNHKYTWQRQNSIYQ